VKSLTQVQSKSLISNHFNIEEWNYVKNINLKIYQSKKDSNKMNRDRIWKEKKNQGGWNCKKKKSKKWSQTKQLSIKRMMIKFERIKNKNGMKLKNIYNFINYSK
jgi:hypothetical protein